MQGFKERTLNEEDIRADLKIVKALQREVGVFTNIRQIITVISAAAAGNVSAGMGEFAQRAAVSYLQTLGVENVEQIADDLDSETTRAALQGIVGCAGAAASGVTVPLGRLEHRRGSLRHGRRKRRCRVRVAR
ncbi:hypothetical protein ACPWR0_18915 [Pandoraea pneumonica]|uniref:hypothetical protein n=1 Tax=Pandoraea pneumonica TaxID=2508299 RepID=UPI003CE812C2